MSGISPPADRALIRLRQLAKEQRAAIAHGDVEGLCRISDLLPTTIAAIGGSPFDDVTAQAVIDDARAAQVEAEQFLLERMQGVKALLQQISKSRTSVRAYAGPPAAARRIDGAL